MYRVEKVINNNALLAYDEDKNIEVIFLGTGVGFGKIVDCLFAEIDRA